MNTYQELILRELKTDFPQLSLKVSAEIEFEAISKIVFGSKQRRFGPLPTPEAQTHIRQSLRDGLAQNGEDKSVVFFVPWACSKQNPNDKLDILELYALKQLVLLQDELLWQGIESSFVFRLEDLGDALLLDPFWFPGELADDRNKELIYSITKYGNSFKRLARRLLRNSVVQFESDVTFITDFAAEAKKLYAPFLKVLQDSEEELPEDFNWVGGIPEQQKEYYINLFSKLYPHRDPIACLAWYFSIVMARHKVNAYLAPKDSPYVTIAFDHPVPGSPNKVLHYRTLPERYTHRHYSPWMSKGVFQIDEQGCVTPKYIDVVGTREVITNVIKFNGVPVSADYYLL